MKEWEQSKENSLALLSEAILAAGLVKAVDAAWQDPAQESQVRMLWQEVLPGVCQSQFLDPEQLQGLRQYLQAVMDAQVPLRPPYGIVLNRYEAMLDQKSEGYLAAPGFQTFYQILMDRYMRPIARMLFPEITGYDSQTFGFSIQYQAGMDTSLRLHTDASAATLNINMNMKGETFSGSEVDFYDPSTGKVSRLSFKPGVAMLHRGNIPHAAQPITRGERSNLVLWLYGAQGSLPRGYTDASLNPDERWNTPKAAPDTFTPF